MHTITILPHYPYETLVVDDAFRYRTKSLIIGIIRYLQRAAFIPPPPPSSYLYRRFHFIVDVYSMDALIIYTHCICLLSYHRFFFLPHSLTQLMYFFFCWLCLAVLLLSRTHSAFMLHLTYRPSCIFFFLLSRLPFGSWDFLIALFLSPLPSSVSYFSFSRLFCYTYIDSSARNYNATAISRVLISLIALSFFSSYRYQVHTTRIGGSLFLHITQTRNA